MVVRHNSLPGWPMPARRIHRVLNQLILIAANVTT